MVEMKIAFSDLTIMAMQKLQANKMIVASLNVDEICRLRHHGLICPNSENPDGGEVLTFIGVNLQQYLHKKSND